MAPISGALYHAFTHFLDVDRMMGRLYWLLCA